MKPTELLTAIIAVVSVAGQATVCHAANYQDFPGLTALASQSEHSTEDVRIREKAEDHCSQLFADTRFMQGFLLGYPDVAKGRSVEAILNLGNAQNKPKWRLCQWATKYSLADARPIRNQYADVTYENEGKRVVLAGPDSPNRDLILEVRGKTEYGQSPRTFGQSWPHLLIEQDTPQIHTLDTLDQVRLTIAFRLLACKSNMMQDQYDPSLHAAQFQLFLIVRNVKKAGDYFWFGVPFFDNRHEIPPSYMAKDVGKKDATGKFIYTIDGRKINTTPPIRGDWINVQKDLLPHIKAGLKEAVKRGYFSDSAIEHYAIVNMNLGWEIPGNFNASVQIKNFSVCARLKSE